MIVAACRTSVKDLKYIYNYLDSNILLIEIDGYLFLSFKDYGVGDGMLMNYFILKNNNILEGLTDAYNSRNGRHNYLIKSK